MFRPAQFRADDPQLHRAIVEDYPLALLITSIEGIPFATPVPLLLEDGALLGHIARNNPQWRHFADREVLVAFSGPHAYISPRWYREPEQHVPTWNYVALHAYGRAAILDHATTAAMLGRLVARFDPDWSAAPELVDELVPAVVGFRVDVTRWEGKLKLSQNRDDADRERVRDVLLAGDEAERAVGRWMSR